jgi:hypothetical protein
VAPNSGWAVSKARAWSAGASSMGTNSRSDACRRAPAGRSWRATT